MTKRKYKTMSNEDKYIFVALTNMLLFKAKKNYECYITLQGTIRMKNMFNSRLYTKNGIVLENKLLFKELNNQFLHMANGCYIKTCKETSRIYHTMLVNYLNS